MLYINEITTASEALEMIEADTSDIYDDYDDMLYKQDVLRKNVGSKESIEKLQAIHHDVVEFEKSLKDIEHIKGVLTGLDKDCEVILLPSLTGYNNKLSKYKKMYYLSSVEEKPFCTYTVNDKNKWIVYDNSGIVKFNMYKNCLTGKKLDKPLIKYASKYFETWDKYSAKASFNGGYTDEAFNKISEYFRYNCTDKSSKEVVEILNNYNGGKIVKCKECGLIFILTNQHLAYFEENKLSPPKRCHVCRHKRKNKS